MMQPNPSLTNKATIAERGKYRHQPQRSHRLIKAQVQTIRADCLLSPKSKNELVRDMEGQSLVITKRDNDILHYAIGDQYYDWHLQGILLTLPTGTAVRSSASRRAPPEATWSDEFWKVRGVSSNHH